MAVPTALFQFERPIDSVNYVRNPSAEAGSGTTPLYAAAVGSATVTRSNNYARQVTGDASWSFRVQTSGTNAGIRLTMEALPSDTTFITFNPRGTYIAANLRAVINGVTKTPELYETDGAWGFFVNDTDPWTGATVSGQTTIDILHTTSGADFYIDDIVVQQGTWTTPFHGSYPGCEWDGIAHQSKSYLHAVVDNQPNLAAGEIVTFGNQTTCLITKFAGWGVPDLEPSTTNTVQQGRVFQSAKLGPRSLALSATLTYHDQGTLASHHTNRATLLDYMPPGERFVFRYRANPTIRGGTADVIRLEVRYEAGLRGDLDFSVYWENAPVTLTADDPLYMVATATATSLTMATSATISYAIRKRRDQGWDTPGGGLGVNSLTYAMASSPKGHFYAGGSGGSSNLRGWDGSAWADCGVLLGGTLQMQTIAFDPSGTALYVGGQWTTSVGGVANTVRIAKYTLPSSGVSGGTWTALGTGMNGTVRKIVTVPTATGHDVYAFGEFTTAGGTSANYAAKWNGSAWSALGPNTASSNGYVYDALYSPDGYIYMGGAWTTFGTVSAPSAPTLSTAISGNLNGTYGYKVSATTAQGETLCSTAGGPTSPSSTQGVRVTYSLPTGATGGWIYRTIASGTIYYRLAPVVAGTTTFDDDGSYTLSTVLEPTVATDGARSKRVGKYDIANNAFVGVGQTGMNGTVKAIARGADGALYAGGSFGTADGLVANRFAVCVNDLVWSAAGGDGTDGGGVTGGDVETILVLPSGEVAVGGAFTAVKDSLVGTLGANLALWHPGSLGGSGWWTHGEVVFPSATTVLSLTLDHNRNLWVGFNTSGTGSYPARTTVTSSGMGGAFLSYPKLYFLGPGLLRYIENANTGHRLWLNLPIATDETVMFDLDKGEKTITSSLLDPAGNAPSRASRFVAGDLGSLGLRAGDNLIGVHYTGTSGNAAVKLSDRELRISADR